MTKTIMERMDEIVAQVEELKKLTNYQEDKVEDSFTSEQDAETQDPDRIKYPKNV